MHGLPIETPSLRLRQMVLDDAAPFMALNAEPSTRQWLPSHVYPSLEEATSRVQYLVACYLQPGHPKLGPYVLSIDHKTSGKLLGHVGFSPFHGEVEVSYAIAESSRGCGYGTEALVRACTWLNEEFSVPQILALTESANDDSCRLLIRADFFKVNETVMRFQGQDQLVSRYYWQPRRTRGGD